jgi:hypothetical protein
MFHLIDRIYLVPDFMIDVHKDRIVISKENGYDMHEVISKLSNGILYKHAQEVENVVTDGNYLLFFKEIIEFSRSRNRSLYIYADKYALPKIQAEWFSIVLQNVDNANVYKFNLIYKSSFSSNSGEIYATRNINPNLIEQELSKVKTYKTAYRRKLMIDPYKDSIGVEYLLATYLYNGKMKDPLKKSIAVLLKKSFDDVLLEYKSLFLSFFTNEPFADKLQLKKKYSFHDLNITAEDGRVAEFFLSGRLYKTKEITKASANSNFQFKLMTKEDFETLNMFTAALGSYYTYNESIIDFNDGLSPMIRDGYKWQFLPAVASEFTDELLNKLIDVEASIDYPVGIFYGYNLETVNGFLVQHILKLYKNNDFESLKHFIIID